jgi:hypothetical protein
MFVPVRLTRAASLRAALATALRAALSTLGAALAATLRAAFGAALATALRAALSTLGAARSSTLRAAHTALAALCVLAHASGVTLGHSRFLSDGEKTGMSLQVGRKCSFPRKTKLAGWSSNLASCGCRLRCCLALGPCPPAQGGASRSSGMAFVRSSRRSEAYAFGAAVVGT